MRWDEVAKQAVIELSKHGPDGLFFASMFALLLVATRRGISGWTSLPAPVVCGSLYVVSRIAGQAYAVRMARLPVERQAARIAAIKEPHRARVGGIQQTLPLEERPRGSRPGGNEQA
jgi:hypothetical protein